IPRKQDASVIIYERFTWQDEAEKQTINKYGEDKAKAEISKHKWKMLEDTLRTEFNSRLKKPKLPAGRFVIGQTFVERMLGKELLVLVWAVEDCDPANVSIAIRNWLGLAPEERWWLYTMTNAATGNIDDRRGWRKALRYALCENPIDEQRQFSLFDAMLKRGEEE
ncbi:MAG: DUF3780 domain-containing protein, partial [Eubacteriales bacterium]|nr:DUF3780 domain-containing protein [Eubacteriales bacterium]